MTVKKYYIKMLGTEYELHSFEYKKQNSSTIDTTKLTLSRTQDAIFDIGDDVSIGYHDATDTFERDFNGDVTNKESDQELTLTMESYAGRVYRTELITEVHEDKTLEWIVEWLITTYTDLTYAGTETTGISLERFVINSETAGEAIDRILKEIDWQIRVDNDKNFYFEPNGHTSAAVSLAVGTNVFMESNWKKNPNRLINSCTVVGDKAKFNTNETFSPIAAQTEFTLTYKITGNVRVTVDGTEKVGGQDGSVGTFDYSIDKEQKLIKFESGMAGSETVIVYYEYELPIKITAQNQVSVDAYGTFPKKITDNTLKTTADARKFAKKIVSTYGTPTLSGDVSVSWDEDIDVGETVAVTDIFNSINQDFVVISSVKKYPEGSKKISLGVEELDLLNMDKDLSDRIKRLEAKQDNTDILQKYMTFSESVSVVSRPGRRRVRTRNIASDVMIWGNADFGVWDEDQWGSTVETSFILGNSIAAILGTSKLGSQVSEWVVVSVTNPNDIMYERFEFDTYKDSSTTATGWT